MAETNHLTPSITKQPTRAEGGSRGKRALDGRSSPLVSVIVVAYRDREEVAALIDNIGPFRGPDLELVIIDGGSGDGTLELLLAHNDAVDYWMSEPDSGVYEAMNKGIAVANGEYILHLNAGDRLLLVPTAELAACSLERVDVASFRVQLDGGSVHIPRSSFSMRISNAWHHQGTFYRRSAHLGYDPAYRVFGDFDHNQRMAKEAKSVRIFHRVISSHGSPGLSASKTSFCEVFDSIRKNSGVIYVPIAFLHFKIDGIRRRFARLLRRDRRKAQ